MEKEETEKKTLFTQETEEEKQEEEEEEEEEEKWVKYYSSNHEILLVGDGDFSFSLCLANSFGSASNIVASSLDPYDVVINMYKEAKSNLEYLEKLGAFLLHGVDATQMKHHTDLQMRKFDRIIFNFPHAGFHGKEDKASLIKKHMKLVNGFFRNARSMLRPNGEIHVNHKTTAPFCCWDLEGTASQNSLVLIECVEFKREDYPGYNNKRGASSRCDEPFPLGECSTFKFRFSPTAAKKMSKRFLCHTSSIGRCQPLEDFPIRMPPLQPQEFLSQTQQQSTSPVVRYPQIDFISNMNGNVQEYVDLPYLTRIRNDCSGSFSGYFTHVVETFGRSDTDDGVAYSIRQALNHGYARYKAEAPGRTLTGYIYLLDELHRLSTLRAARLKRRLLDFDQ